MSVRYAECFGSDCHLACQLIRLDNRLLFFVKLVHLIRCRHQVALLILQFFWSRAIWMTSNVI